MSEYRSTGGAMRKLAAIVISFAAVGLAATPALATDANGNHESYRWVVATDTAMAADGSTITLTGHGTLTAGPDSAATGGGTFTNSRGESGTWTVSGVEGFVSYGTRLPGSSFPPPPATGGMTKLRVALSNGQTGVLTIFCVIGSPPPPVMEGIHLVLVGGVSDNYTMQMSGNTIFFAI
jgi:hypothetical protein